MFWPFSTRNSAKYAKIHVSSILQNVSTGFTWNLFSSSLELLLEACRIWPHRVPWAQEIKTQFVRNISWRLLGQILWFESHMKALWPLDAYWLDYFPLGALGVIKRVRWAQIVSAISYMSVNTGMIFALIMYRGYMVTFNTRSLFNPPRIAVFVLVFIFYVDMTVMYIILCLIKLFDIICWQFC